MVYIKNTYLVLVCVFFMLLAVHMAEASGSEAMHKMEEIMLRLKHFPSPQGKQELQNLIDNKTIMNLQHRATDADKVKLKQIMDSTGSSADERDLASIVYNLDHRPTKEDKERLKRILGNYAGQ